MAWEHAANPSSALTVMHGDMFNKRAVVRHNP
jgi:hypothetical protein